MSAHHDDFATEPVPGLPQPLPEGEHILWQGAPHWQRLAREVFHAPLAALYLTGLIAWRAETLSHAGYPAGTVGVAVLGLSLPALAGIGLLCLLARLYAGNTLYTITNRRVVIRSGIALTLAINLPFRLIGGASLTARPDGSGNIALAMMGEERLAYAHLWPNVRPWRINRPQPMLRAIADAHGVARLLGNAVRDAVPQARLSFNDSSDAREAGDMEPLAV